MVVNNNMINNLNRISGKPNITSTPKNDSTGGDFNSIFKDKLEGLKFSKHAELRLQSRNINLTQVQKDKINAAVTKAGEKGVKDSLVIMDNLAFVVNVRSKTVITAVNSSELKDNVFTNIDGAVFA